MAELQIVRRIRGYQAPLYRYLMGGGKRAIEIAHRRWGKDEVALAATCELAHARVGSYWHCLPEYAQARKALWTAVNAHTGRRRIDEAFPPEIRRRTNDQQMFIELANGSTWQLIGSDRYDSTVGAGVAGVVYSEWALANPSAWGYHRPMLVENDGWALFITTPRGRNHAHAMYQRYQREPGFFAEVSTIYDTGALTDEQIAESRAEYIDLYGEDLGRAQFEQEYECSFNAAILGAFYAGEMAAVRRESRVQPFEPIPDLPVITAWDIGVRDSTAIWWAQVDQSGTIWVLDFYMSHGAGVDHYAEILQSRPYRSGRDYVPHDAKVREWGTGRTRLEVMREHKLRPALVPNVSKLDGIQAVRKTLPRCVFHPRCEEGLAALEQYRREWDDGRKTFRESEVKDWSVHAADSFRYLSLSWRDAAQDPPPAEERRIQVGGRSTETFQDLMQHVRKRRVGDA